MGIESDQLVFDYLSRVGDLAQQRQLPSGTRMRLVSELRGEIDRRRARTAADSPAAVRRILDRLGSPETVVLEAGRDGAGGAEHDRRARSGAALPPQRDKEPAPRSGLLRRAVPKPRPAEPETPAESGGAPSPPHLAGTDELGSSQTDWWRVERSPFGTTDAVPGFVGGVEIPELLRPPPEEPDGNGPGTAPKAPAAGARPAVPVVEQDGPVDPGRRRGRFLPRLRPVGGGWSNPLLLLAAALLVAGAVVGNLVLLGLGWLIAYLSRRLSPTESKWAVLGVPGLVAAAGVTWLWGRAEGRWGAPVAEGAMSDAVAETWPWVLRGAAVASALYLVWRSQRPR
ncbi:hypothetical protein [Streptomyces fructofermentans]|uniref:Membrane protein n=1 Tax=Streptomyces fructofermentans TaxID=152141 RepID=A0A918K3G6_9ACTN|nr:hypothetical protein [Streptomyces fructofermentans]GGX46936.1 membrane protein [Streptomyces fructofermentans]